MSLKRCDRVPAWRRHQGVRSAVRWRRSATLPRGTRRGPAELQTTVAELTGGALPSGSGAVHSQTGIHGRERLPEIR